MSVEHSLRFAAVQRHPRPEATSPLRDELRAAESATIGGGGGADDAEVRHVVTQWRVGGQDRGGYECFVSQATL